MNVRLMYTRFEAPRGKSTRTGEYEVMAQHTDDAHSNLTQSMHVQGLIKVRNDTTLARTSYIQRSNVVASKPG